jgi:uncharacterized coiled-coil protein SlyX
MDKKIIELEEKLTHFEHTIEALNNVVFRQTQKIDELEAILKHLSAQIRQSNDAQDNQNITTDDPPQHY